MRKINLKADAATAQTTAKEMYPMITLQNFNWRLFKKSITDDMKTNGCEGCLVYNQYKRFSAKNLNKYNY
jgi:hypothetical protein